jgi:hypothetical protein
MLRLPGAVEPVFLDWLDREGQERRSRVEGRLREMHGGATCDRRFGLRMSGSGEMAEQIAAMFRLFRRRAGLDGPLPEFDYSQFRRPRGSDGQGWLF